MHEGRFVLENLNASAKKRAIMAAACGVSKVTVDLAR
jgi:hypothetical protein